MSLPIFKAATVQASPIYLNAELTVRKACDLIKEAALNGARLVAFPEVFIPAYPYWSWIMSPTEGSAFFERLYHNSIDIDGSEVQILCQAAKLNDCYIVIGLNERGPKKIGTLYNTNITISPSGEILGRHRKLVPTWAEKLTWSGGDGSTLTVHDTDIGMLGTLACGENTNPLARFTLMAQGEQVHIANYIGLPTAPKDYNMAEAIKLRGMTHSFEGKIFTIISCSAVSEEIILEMEKFVPNARELLTRKNGAFSGVIDPNGNLIGEGLIDDEGIVYAEIDLNRCIQPKQMHDILGHYNRFDIFDLKVNRAVQTPFTFVNEVYKEDSLNQSLNLSEGEDDKH
jgi:aliphatic nitrilase